MAGYFIPHCGYIFEEKNPRIILSSSLFKVYQHIKVKKDTYINKQTVQIMEHIA